MLLPPRLFLCKQLAYVLINDTRFGRKQIILIKIKKNVFLDNLTFQNVWSFKKNKVFPYLKKLIFKMFEDYYKSNTQLM